MSAPRRGAARGREQLCPAHGSRFDCEGTLLNGPAVGDMMEAPAQIEDPTYAIPEPVGDTPYPLRAGLEPT